MASKEQVWFIISKLNGVEYPGVVVDPVPKHLAAPCIARKLRIDTLPDFEWLSRLSLDDLHKALNRRLMKATQK